MNIVVDKISDQQIRMFLNITKEWENLGEIALCSLAGIMIGKVNKYEGIIKNEISRDKSEFG